MKNEKGITIVTLIIAIIVLLLLAGVTVKVGTSLIKQVQIENVKTNLLLIQAKTKIIYEKNQFDEEENPLKGTQIELTQDEVEKYEVETQKGDKQYKFYKLSKQDLIDMKLEEISYDEGYIVNYETQDIIYVKGIEGNDKSIYYTLSQITGKIDEDEESLEDEEAQSEDTQQEEDEES